MECPEASSLSVNTDYNGMHLYKEALSCMELIASQLEEDYADQPVVNKLYEQCTSAILQLRNSNHNPHISDSLESLLGTLAFQQSLLEVCGSGQRFHRRRTFSEDFTSVEDSGKSGRGSWSRTVSECAPSDSEATSLEKMMLPNFTKRTGSFEDVVGMDEVKQILMEAVIMPSRYPQLFQGGAKPWTKLLLYGPPGTGKTKIAKALAAEIDCKFYSVSPASVLSSWVGESEKMVQDLFDQARRDTGQSIIFIDEIDSLCRKRSQKEDEHSRRLKTELLKQMEGIDEDDDSDGNAGVFLLGATNCPWDLDPAFLRRFQRRIFVPLPNREGRRHIIAKQFKTSPLQLTDSEWIKLLDITDGYSGADLTHLTMAAAFQPIRELQSSRYWQFTNDNKITPCSSDVLGAMQYTLNKLPADRVLARDVEMKDFFTAIKSTPRTISPSAMQQYSQFSSSTVHMT